MVVTLIYLAAQIRQNTRAMEDGQKFAMANAYHARTELVMQLSSLEDPEIMAKVRSADGHIDLVKADQLPDVERRRLITYLEALMYVTDNACYQQKLGLIPETFFAPGSPGYETLEVGYPAWTHLGGPNPVSWTGYGLIHAAAFGRRASFSWAGPVLTLRF